ncbi:hypothetical protein DESUT3_06570 [Desulfuromonas versatilis]|uniref:DUF2325 domain-containing protein n=1 Tax=Desulfuromonas versatilis TaxID=2802975 RepID=A0ABM8HPH2_9BACT|nr:DUF2325 domain-containing protein [Desulfuromonas versatilis]BCR03588.1 hypothetical protein DESUT3_06570 [Desulfuromonas versatilis]
MSIVVVGGMDRLERHYRREAEKLGHQLQVFNSASARMSARIQGSDALVLFTNKISHKARNEAVATARKSGIPVYMYHSCGLCTLRDCLQCLGCGEHSPG